MIITLVRHGEVEEAYHHCYNGHNDIALSDKGITEALQLSEYFSQQSFDAIYSSDLRRCKETTQTIISTVIPAKAGIHEPKHSDNTNTLIPVSTGMTKDQIVYTKALREKSWGKHEGMTFDAITQRDALIYQDFSQWINALDGEPYDAYIERIKTFFTTTLPLTPYNNVLVVTHAGVIRVLMHLLQKISLEEAFSINFPYSAYTTLDTNTWQFGETQCV